MTLLRRLAAAAISALVALSPVAAMAAHAATGLAADDAYPVLEDQTLIVPSGTLLGVLDNDAGGSLVLCVSSFDTTGLQGTLQDPGVNADGSFTYTPPPNFNGTTTFTYAVATLIAGVCPPPPTAEGTATVTLTVAPVNDPPTAVADAFTALANHTLNVAAPGVLGNDADVDGDPLTAVKKSSPAHGAVTLAADGSFSYTPATGYTGPDQFSYWASDGTDHSVQRLVSLTVVAVPPPPTPTPVPTATPAPPTVSPEPSPTESPLPSESGPPTPSPEATALPSASPSASPITGPVSGGGGLPIVAIGALALLLGLLAVAGVFFVRSQRSGETDPEVGYSGEYDDDIGDDRV